MLSRLQPYYSGQPDIKGMYLQGFYTVTVLFVYKIPGGSSGLSDINTGLKFVTKASVDPYLSTQSRFRGEFQPRKSTNALSTYIIKVMPGDKVESKI